MASLATSWFSAVVPPKVYVVVCFSSPRVCPQNIYRNRPFLIEGGFKLVILENVTFNPKAISSLKSV